jgi:methionine-rich copper-binding protein CopC
MMMRRLGVTALAAALAVLVTASPAAAHTTVKSSVPAANSTVAAPPAAVTLTFTERLSILPTVQVKDAAGAVVNAGDAKIDGSVVTQPVKPGAAGKYTVEWRATAQDGDKSTGSFGFTLTAATTAAPTTAAATTAAPTTATPASTKSPQAAPPPQADTAKSDSNSLWWVIAIPVAALLIAASAIAFVRRSRARKS